jgi:hypothetical protein
MAISPTTQDEILVVSVFVTQWNYSHILSKLDIRLITDMDEIGSGVSVNSLNKLVFAFKTKGKNEPFSCCHNRNTAIP